MKAYLIVTGALFTLMAVLHAFITFEHWRSPDADSLLAPLVVFVLSAVLAIWAFRLVGGIPLPAAAATPSAGASDKPAVNVHTVDQLRAAYARQREAYDWDFSNEREFMENLFCTRFNFLLVAYSLFVTAAATAVSNRELFVFIAFAGATVCFLVSLAIMRAYAKLDVLFKVLYAAFPDHPIAIIDKETAKSGRRLFRVNPIIAYWVPAFTVLSLVAGGVASILCWF